MPIIAKTSFGVSLIANPQRGGWVHISVVSVAGNRHVPMYARRFGTGVAILPFAAAGYQRVDGMITRYVYNELCAAALVDRVVSLGNPDPEMVSQAPIHFAASLFATIDGDSDEAR